MINKLCFSIKEWQNWKNVLGLIYAKQCEIIDEVNTLGLENLALRKQLGAKCYLCPEGCGCPCDPQHVNTYSSAKAEMSDECRKLKPQSSIQRQNVKSGTAVSTTEIQPVGNRQNVEELGGSVGCLEPNLMPLPALYYCHKCNRQVSEDQMGYQCPDCKEWLYTHLSKYINFKS